MSSIVVVFRHFLESISNPSFSYSCLTISSSVINCLFQLNSIKESKENSNPNNCCFKRQDNLYEKESHPDSDDQDESEEDRKQDRADEEEDKKYDKEFAEDDKLYKQSYQHKHRGGNTNDRPPQDQGMENHEGPEGMNHEYHNQEQSPGRQNDDIGDITKLPMYPGERGGNPDNRTPQGQGMEHHR